MFDPWRHVDADDDLVADFLAGTIELVHELGGTLHPDARIVARDGQVQLQCDAEDDVPLVRVPADAFIPISRVQWSASAEALDVEGLLGELSGPQTELLVLQTALHNACGKIPWITATHPVLAPDLERAVVDAVRAFRPSFRRRQPTPASLFWSNRVFRLPPAGSAIPEPMALPIIDLLDHHHGGATGTWTGNAFTVDVTRPTHAATFLDYGLLRDAIGMAVVYGFADVSNPVAHSAPMEVEVPGVGPVRVVARGRARTGELLPPVIDHAGGVMTISRVTFGATDHVDRVEGLITNSSWSRAEGTVAVAAIARRNVELLDDLLASTATSGSAAAAVLAGAAERQRALIAPYVD